jgi:hypothetical protein
MTDFKHHCMSTTMTCSKLCEGYISILKNQYKKLIQEKYCTSCPSTRTNSPICALVSIHAVNQKTSGATFVILISGHNVRCDTHTMLPIRPWRDTKRVLERDFDVHAVYCLS